MTTIATDGNTIAADTQISGRWKNSVRAQKIFDINGDIVGISGELAECHSFLEWYEKGEPANDKPNIEEGSIDIMVLTADGKCYHYYHKLRPCEVSVPYAVGSGSEFAMGAMACGASPREAVEIAASLDPYTNDDIIVMRHRVEEVTVMASEVELVSGVLPGDDVDEDE